MYWTGFTGTFACIFYTEEDDKESTQWPQFYIRDFMKVFEIWIVGFVSGGEALSSSRRQLSQDICDCKVFKAIQEETAKDKAK